MDGKNGNHNKFIPLNPFIMNTFKNTTFNINKPVYVFDIDKTLYPSYLIDKSSKKRLLYLQYLISLGYSFDESNEILFRLRNKYSRTLQGLIEEYNLPDELYKYFIKYNPEKYMVLKNDEDGINLLKNLDGYKICLTNACVNHSKFVLNRMGLIDHIDYVFYSDLENKIFSCKPKEEVYYMVEEFLQIKNKKDIHFFDDKIINVEMANKIGWNGYHVNDEYSYKDILKGLIFCDNASLKEITKD